MEISPTHNQPEFTVSEISGAIKRVVEGNFEHVRVRGEISGLSRPKSGHIYLSLKDESSVLRSVCWKGVAQRLQVQPEDGLEVIATGKITTYAGSSNYQLVIDSLEVAGEGALMALLEKRKKELAAEGLFDSERKKPIPLFPQKIGVVTSPTGAVIRDIIHRISDRFPLNIILAPVKVQGQGAAEEIAAAINLFANMNDKPDILIVGRGGGSLEDLWCFNEEIVVRAAANCNIPIISAVGHETDWTLMDLVADMRAPTPTGAAEMATQYTIADLRFTISDFSNRISQGVNQLLQNHQRNLDGLIRGLPKLDEIIGNYIQRLDDWAERLGNSLPAFLEKLQSKLKSFQLRPQILRKDIENQNKQLKSLSERLDNSYKNFLETRNSKLETTTKLFESLNYKNVLKRGFALVKGQDGKLIANAATVQDKMIIEFNDGQVEVNKNG
jgi:exodeoxyribonuclease VII large subunit